MATRLIAPSMGEGIEELTVVGWLKKEGDAVKEMEMVVEVETDKVTTEIPSPVSGILLKIMAQVDETVKVGSPMAWIGEPGEEIPAGGAKAKEAPPTQEATPAKDKPPAAPGNEPAAPAAPAAIPAAQYTGYVSPLVRQMAEKNQVDLNQVQGTGQDGRITKDDMLNYLDAEKTAPAPAAPAPAAPMESRPAGQELPAGSLIPHTSVRRQIAQRMVSSKQTSPHVLTVMEADLSRVVAHRSANKASFANQGANLTLTAYFCAAIVSALKANPLVNSSWTEEGIQTYNVVNLGVATALGKDGLIVPVIKDAGSLSLLGLAKSINDLAGRARAKKLRPEEVRGGTFTLTNHGSAGSLFASPIIFQPQAGILGTGVMQKRAVVITDGSGNDAIAIRPMVYLSFVFDHRILDGESADNFLSVVKKALENWGQSSEQT
jgi:2-oxoglutarate dehydrogenase E2 component (dihydrolipoamide succinyltransferase)